MARPKRANGEGSWTKRKDGRLRLRVSYTDETKDFYGTTRQEAISKRKQYEALKSVNTKTGGCVTVEEYMTKWYEEVHKQTLRPKTADRFECTTNNYIFPEIGHIKLNQLESSEIQTQVINKMYNRGLSQESIKKAKSALNVMYKYATASNKVLYNPVLAVNVPSVDKFKKKEMRYFSKQEREKFIETCNAKFKNGRRRYKYGSEFVLMLYTGLRIAEALALQWKDVDLIERKIKITHQLVAIKNRSRKSEDDPNWVIADQPYPKNSNNRTIYISDMAYEALIDLQKIYGNKNKTQYIIHTPDGNPISPRRAADTLDRICDRMEITNFSPHCLRHSAASLMYQNEVPLQVISQILGHSSMEITMKRYVHLLEDAQVESMKIIKNMR